MTKRLNITIKNSIKNSILILSFDPDNDTFSKYNFPKSDNMK